MSLLIYSLSNLALRINLEVETWNFINKNNETSYLQILLPAIDIFLTNTFIQKRLGCIIMSLRRQIISTLFLVCLKTTFWVNTRLLVLLEFACVFLIRLVFGLLTNKLWALELESKEAIKWSAIKYCYQQGFNIILSHEWITSWQL